MKTNEVARQLQTHGLALRTLARDLVGDHAADDLVQETALRALTSPPKEPGPLGGWFATILRRLASKHRRSEHRRLQRERIAARAEAVASGADGLATREMLERLTSAVLQLPEPYRSAILGRYLQAQAPRTIAASTGQSVATVKSQLQRGLQMLRVRLGEVVGSEWRSGLVLAFALGVAGRDAAAATGVVWTTKAKVALVGSAVVLGFVVVPKFVDARVEPKTKVEAAVAGAADAQQRALPESAPPPATERGPANATACEVRVVDARSGLPVAGARVLVDPYAMDPDRVPAELVELKRTDPDAFLFRVSPFLETDANGTVRVSLHPEEPTGITASTGLLWGVALAEAGASVSEVRVHPDRTLRVRAVDAHGRSAVGVPVEVRHSFSTGVMYGTLGHTDANGLVSERHVQRRAEDASSGHVVVARFTGGESAPVAFDPNDPPNELVVALPATGTVRVRLRDALGRALSGEHFATPQVGMHVRDTRTSPAPLPGFMASKGEFADVDARGEAFFSYVALGKFVEPSMGGSFAKTLVPGPTAEAPDLAIELREIDGLVVLTGRVVDEAGAPVTGFGFLLLPALTSAGIATSGRTDAAGQFRVVLRRAVVGESFEGTLRAEPPSFDRTLGCEVVVPRVSAGTTDLGDLVVEPLPMLVSGRVFVVSHANVEVQLQRLVGDTWHGVLGLRPAWSSDRRFAFHGRLAEARPLRLHVHAGGLPPVEPVEFEPGATDLAIALQRGGSVDAVILHDGGFPLDGARVRLRRLDGTSSSPTVAATLRRAQADRTDVFWRGVPAGRYRLEVSGADTSDVVHAVDELTIGEGPCTDERLREIDLRGRAQVVEVRVLDADGNEIRDRNARVVVRCGDDRWHASSVGDGVARIACRRPVDVLALAPGHLAAFVDGVGTSRILQLLRAPRVAVRVEASVAGDAAPVREVHFAPRLGQPSRARFVGERGDETALEGAFEDAVTLDADGRGTWMPRFSTEFVVSGRVAAEAGAMHWCFGFAPRTVRGPFGEELVIRRDR